MSAYQQGQDAYKDGKGPSDNPYSRLTSKGDDWLDGWLYARETFTGERGV